MTELRYWFECPKCGTRIWTSHNDRRMMQMIKPHCPACGTPTRNFIDRGLARARWAKPWWKFERELVNADGEVLPPINTKE